MGSESRRGMKKDYNSPEIREYGSALELTLGGSHSARDWALVSSGAADSSGPGATTGPGTGCLNKSVCS
jgi:hypothetical protein